MRFVLRRIPIGVAACFFALVLTLLMGGIWSALLIANLRSTPAWPWSVPVMAALLWLRQQTGEQRPLPRRGGQSRFPFVTVSLVIGMASIVNAVAEEAGLRGYLQGMLEADLGGPVAISITALVIAPGHGLTQGFAWPTFVFYLLADATFGTLAYLTRSIRPGIIVHAAGICAFFTLVWPHDAARPDPAGDPWFVVHVTQVLIFGLAAILAFRRLARIATAAFGQR